MGNSSLWKIPAAKAASTSVFSKTSLKCSTLPAPDEAMTGIDAFLSNTIPVRIVNGMFSGAYLNRRRSQTIRSHECRSSATRKVQVFDSIRWCNPDLRKLLQVFHPQQERLVWKATVEELGLLVLLAGFGFALNQQHRIWQLPKVKIRTGPKSTQHLPFS
jgi:hypothetical protein